MNMKKDKNWDIGEKLYDSFVENLGSGLRVCTPRTTTLELFAVLSKRGMQTQLLAEMCREFANNFDDDIFAEKGSLYQRDTIKTKI